MGSQYWNTLVNNKDLRLNQPDASQRENIQGGEVFRRVRKCHELEQLYINKHFEILESFNTLIQLLSTDYKFAVSFSILVIVLLFRPSGIFEGKKI